MTMLSRKALQLPLPHGRARNVSVAWLLCAATLLLTIPAAKAETLKVGGAGAALGPMRVLAAEFTKLVPAHSVVVVPDLGSGGGVKALAAGAIDMAAISRPLRADEVAQGLVGVAYGKTALIVVTSAKGAGSVRTFAELAEIYAGHRTTWAGGGPIRLVLRPQANVDTQLLEAFSPELKRVMSAALVRPGMVVASTDQEAADYIERTSGAIGFTSLALVRAEKRNVHVLPLNGVVPSPRTVADGSYPYVKEMVLVRKGPGTPAVARFFEFVASPQGRQILTDTGHWVADTRAAR